MFNFNKTAALAAPLFAFVQVATAQNSNLVIFSEDAHKFYVIINGVQQNNIAQTNVKITNFEQNMAKVRIVFENNSLNTIDKTVYFNEPNTEWVYNIKLKKGKLQMRYMTYRPLSANPDAGQYVHQYGQPVPAATTTTVTTQVTETTTTSSNPNNGNANVNVNSNGSNPNNGNANVSINSNTSTSSNPNNGSANVSINSSTSTSNNPNNGNANVSINSSSNGNANMDNSNLSINMGVNDGTGGANISINVSGSGMNTSTTIVDTNGNGIPDEQENWQNGNANVNINMSGNGSNPTSTSSSTTTTTTTTTTVNGQTTTSSNSSANNNTAAMANCFTAMADTDYEQVKKSVAAKSFESEQVIVAKQACKKGCMTAAQIKGVMKVIKFDDGRLEFAKFAYPYCIDQSNYYQVNEAFSHSSSVEELDKAIEGK